MASSTSTTTNSTVTSKVSTSFWFPSATLAQDAANFYVSVFPNSSIAHTQYYLEAGRYKHGQNPGDVMVIAYSLLGGAFNFVNLNGGCEFPGSNFTMGISFQIDCDDQAEVDYYWGKLGEGGNMEKQECGWLQDKFGISWQVVPRVLKEMLAEGQGEGGNVEGAARVTEAMMGMKKMDIEGLKKAFEGKE